MHAADARALTAQTERSTTITNGTTSPVQRPQLRAAADQRPPAGVPAFAGCAEHQSSVQLHQSGSCGRQPELRNCSGQPQHGISLLTANAVGSTIKAAHFLEGKPVVGAGFIQTVKELAERFGIPMPEIEVTPEQLRDMDLINKTPSRLRWAERMGTLQNRNQKP